MINDNLALTGALSIAINDEVVQETFVRVYKKRKDLDNVKYFTSFILRIATNYSIDLLRKRKGHFSKGPKSLKSKI